MEQFDVAIVGAGPTGLACGIELKRRGISTVLFDKGCVVNSHLSLPDEPGFLHHAGIARDRRYPDDLAERKAGANRRL